MLSKVSSDWLPSYVKATRPVLEIFKMAGYFPDSPRISDKNYATALPKMSVNQLQWATLGNVRKPSKNKP